MLERSIIDKLIPILKKDARRTLKMKVRGFPRPFYNAFLLRDVHWFNTWASSGSTYRRRSDHTRNVWCDLRVGSYRLDQTQDGGLYDNDDEIESYNHVKVPIDDKHLDGLRIALWRLSESKFREALTDWSTKAASQLSTVDPNRKYASFAKLGPKRFVKYSRLEKVDEEGWVRFCKRASKWISDLKDVTGNWVEFDAVQETKIFVNTEGRVIVQHQRVFTLIAGLRNLTKSGLQLDRELVINRSSQRGLPDMKSFKRQILKKYDQLKDLITARKIHSFSGPVLLKPIPAGLLFHEAIGHRLEGSRLLSSGEGQTFKGQIGKKVINIPLNIRDNPTLKTFRGKKLIGAFDFDDEGVKTTDALLVEAGRLRGFLNTRAQIPARGNTMNGHARNVKFQRPISRMGVTIVEGIEPVSEEDMREMLVAEVRRQKKPFGMIVYETMGGETDTTSYDFQAFSGEISYAALIYPDGTEEIVRGVDFVGTPLQALNNIIAVGNDPVADNHYCGAESGYLPVTTIAPSVLLSNLELQSKDEELVTQYILPRPRLKKGLKP